MCIPFIQHHSDVIGFRAHTVQRQTNLIDFKYSISVQEQLPVSDVDLTSILSNALENAIKALATAKSSLVEKADISNAKISEIKTDAAGVVSLWSFSRMAVHLYHWGGCACYLEILCDAVTPRRMEQPL